MQRQLETCRSHFKKVRFLGGGATGQVYLVRHRSEPDKLYAMKVISKADMIQSNRLRRVLTEREILTIPQHPFLVTMHWCWHAKDKVYFVMDYCSGGDFYQMLQRLPNKVIPEAAVKFYSAEIVLALEYLHLKGYIYRDLKPENLLLCDSGHIKLSDFDLSKCAGKPTSPCVIREFLGNIIKVSVKPECISNSFVGTPSYLAPEIITGPGHTFAVDWWALGVLLYEMLFGTVPFQGDDQDAIFRSITAAQLKLPKTDAVSKNARKLIKGLLTLDPTKRLGTNHGAADIKEHPFYADVNWALLRSAPPPVIPNVAVESRGESISVDVPAANDVNFKDFALSNIQQKKSLL